MKFVYLTFKKYPSPTADAYYVKSLAQAFANILHEAFSLVVLKSDKEELKEIPHINLNFNVPRLRPMRYFIWIPFFVIKNGRWGKETTFFSNDPFLLSLLLLWRMVFRFRYKVCADWHMIVEDWKSTFIAHRADAHITTTKHLRKQIVALGASEERTKTVYGGVRLLSEETADRVKLGLPEDTILIGYVGLFKTLGQEKGIRTLIDSLQHLPSEVQVVAVGGTKVEIAEYEAYAKEKGVADRCVLIERVPPEKVLLYQKTLDILVIPYPDKPHFRDYGFPMKTYEYMASGTPILYSNLPIMDEVLGEYGKSFQADDAHSLAMVAQKILSEDTSERTMRMKERVRVLTWDHKAQEILDTIYE